VIPCCADMGHFDYHQFSEAQKAALRQQLGIDTGSKVLSYLGSLSGWYMTDEMLDFFALMRTKIPGVVFLLITQDNKRQLLAKVSARGIPAETVYVQPASRDEVPLLLSISSWNLFFIKDAYSKKASSPTKQGEVMAMGIPIICNDIGDTGKIVKESNAGILVNSFGMDAYKDVCSQLISMPQANKEHIRQSAIHYYDLDQGVKEYKKVYERLLK
jgi:glycosyltransferase involved in cell wall biosynthesis